VRRRFTNNTGATITRLRFRIVDITTLNSPGYVSGGTQADLRATNSTAFAVTTSLGSLTVNGGSSSIKFALFTPGEPPQRQLSGSIERIGLPDAVFTVQDADAQPQRRAISVHDHAHAVSELIHWLDKRIGFSALAAVGHRVVHGGMHFSAPQRITAELLDELRRLCPIDPAHLPAVLEGLAQAKRRQFATDDEVEAAFRRFDR